jgi:hypothetical protein
VADHGQRAAIEAALERLCTDVLLYGASLRDDSPTRLALVRAIESLRQHLERNPDWLDDVLADLAAQAERDGNSRRG